MEIFETGNVIAYETIFQTLKEEQFVFFDGTADRDARRGGLDAEKVTVADAWPGQRSGHQVSQLVTAGPGFDGGNRAGELAVFGRVRIRIDVNGLDRFQGQLDRGITGHRVSHVQTRHQDAALVRPRAF